MKVRLSLSPSESAHLPRLFANVCNYTGVKFVIGQIGTDVQATAFIESLGKNPDIAPVAFIMTGACIFPFTDSHIFN